MLGNLSTVLFISNACHHLLQQPNPSIISFIATFLQAEKTVQNISLYHLSIFRRLLAAISGLAVNKTFGYNASHWCIQGHNIFKNQAKENARLHDALSLAC